MAKLIAKTYGDALFEVGMEKDIVDSLREEVKAVSDLLDQNKELNYMGFYKSLSKKDVKQI